MIEVKHLKTLQALRNCGSLAAAAATLHQTQSALSHQFSDLEQRLGFRLFVRKSQPLRFTPQGEILLQLANQVLPQISQALQACNEPQQTRLRIAIECHSCIQWLTPALENFHKNWPQVEMDFKSGVTFDPQPALQQGELDLVMTSDILPRSGLHYSPMFDYEVRLVLAPDHPLAAKTRITPEDLASETLLIYPVQPTVRRRARWRAASADYRSVYSFSAQSRLRSSAVCEERGATHLRCTHSEARITSAPVINVGQCGCWCQIARFTSSPAGTCILFIMPSVPASTCVAP